MGRNRGDFGKRLRVLDSRDYFVVYVFIEIGFFWVDFVSVKYSYFYCRFFCCRRVVE